MVVEELIANGFVTIERAMDPDVCEAIVRSTFEREGWGPDASGWPSGPVHLPVTKALPLGQVAPRAAAALDELVGGVGTTRFSDIPDNLIVNFPVAGHRRQTPIERSRDPEGWHKDGDWFRHFLDSPEQGLLGIVLWRDVEDGQGPTCVAVDSIGPVAELLASHQEGLDPGDLKEPIARILGECTDIRSITGAQGTIVFAHPFLIHAASVNTSATPRVISNTSVMLRQPMSFDRSEGSYTGIERSILHHLGVERLEFEPRGDRGKVTSERERRWADRRDAG
jgi:hypothetical protein